MLGAKRVELVVSITTAVVAVTAVIVCTVLIIRYSSSFPSSSGSKCTHLAEAVQKGQDQGKGLDPPLTPGRAIALVWSQHCKHCKKLKPIFAQFEKAGLPVTTVDGGTKPVAWFVNNRVTRYPTVCVLEQGWDKGEPVVLQQYPPNGERTASSILAFGKATGVFS